MRRLLLIILLTVPVFALQAQQYYFRSYQAGDGLSSNTVTCLQQDARGFMWVGTRNGLNRFDGTRFKVFRNVPEDPHSIGSNAISGLHEDSRKQLWAGTYRGLYRYNALHENFQLYQQLPQGEVKSICHDKRGNIWLVNEQTLYRFKDGTGSIYRYDDASGCIAVSVAANDVVWSCYNNGVIKRFDAATDSFISYDLANLLKTPFPLVLQTICPVGDSAVFVATIKQLFLFKPATGELTDIFKNTGVQGNIQTHTITQQAPGIYWCGTETGIYIADIAHGKTTHITKQVANPYTINDNIVTSFCKDSEGSTWVGTLFGGVNYYSKQLSQFQKYFALPGINSLSGNLVHEICADRYNNVWVGTEDAGLNKLDAGTGMFKQFMPGKTKGSISYHNIHGLVAVDDELWIGTYEHGLDVMDLRTEKVVRHYRQGFTANQLNGNFIVSLYKTRNKEVLVGTWNGVFRYNRTTDDFTALSFFNHQAQAIHEDYNGTLWVCSYGDGVYYRNEKTGRQGSFKTDATDTNTLSSNYVNNVFEDNSHRLWFCTENGLCYYDATAGKIKRYTHPVFNGRQTFKMLQDASNTLWVSTSRGLIGFNTTDNRQQVYTMADGLPSDQFNYNSGFKSNNGNLYFGTVKGMVSFNPVLFKSNRFVPPVYITGLQVNNQDLAIDTTQSPLTQATQFTKEITLPYDASNITLSVSALSYIMPALNSYMYRMEGLEKEWTMIESNRKIYYTKLPPGTYTFQVKGSNSDHVWNENITALTINILPPWWSSWWAYILYVALVSGTLFVIINNYAVATREKNQRRIKTLEMAKEREVYNAKIDFFTNVTHEIRTPLTLIKLPVEKLLRSFAEDSYLKEHLTMIEKNTDRLINLTSQLLDFRRAEANNYTLSFVKTDINELLREVFLIYKPIAEEKQVACRLEIPRITLMAYVDAEALRKIISNLLSNAIKYAAKHVSIKLLPFNSEDNLFHMEFRNDGAVIPYDMREKIFEPFFRLKQTEKFAGTGIGLALARSLTELHKGKLELKQPVNDINLFLLSIPVHQDKEINLDEFETIESDIIYTEADQPAAQKHATTILLVEDNLDIIRFLKKEFAVTYNVFTAKEGVEALDILSKEHIHLVVTDIMMPVMDGIELCRRIKTDVRYSHIPVILLTAKNTITSKIQGLETGADAYIEKPFVMEYVTAQIANLLSNRNNIKEFYAHSPLAHINGIALSKPDTDFLETLQQLINDHITEKDLDVDTISKMMNMSRGTFYRKIKGVSNLSPNELINLSRLKKAAELLAEGKYKINEVANMVGYSLNSNFSRDFHRQFGISPSEYIQHLKRGGEVAH
ncbi:response regulator [Panacibacter sp. DH6]|uniref:histidine kinase n=1 Tax=Panacibacter microcysteis TaxID=2793269 RepID=A0A931GY22_9BACT|nr:hybrid sensor histidine kinase/response regulator transcription factor [Panacibacter microcysteis]MBG9377174.1 response regulator [Panacibacter microcysteis]